MVHSINLGNNKKIEINDVRHPYVFPLEGYAYEITIKPKCSFWRVGLRLWNEDRAPGYSPNNRYNHSQIRHIEICAGNRSENEWQKPNQLEVQQYHFPNAPQTLISFNDYQDHTQVKLEVKANLLSKKIELQLKHKNSEKFELPLGLYKSFQIWGWADFSEFEIDVEVKANLIELPIELKELKALSLLDAPIQLSLQKLSIFFGPNNCGKTSILLAACQYPAFRFNSSNDYVGLNRFYTNSQYDINIEGLNDDERESKQSTNRRKRIELNPGQNEPFDWMVELALLTEETREKVLAWMAQHFEPWQLQEVKTGKFVTGVKPTVNDVNPVEQGSGARAVLPIIIQLFNPTLNVLAIDEPELGLEPKMQKIIFKAIKDATQGINGFPLKRILIATHSHLFLDREEMGNNFSVEKLNGQVVIKRLTESIQLQEATYTLLGCNPGDLFFPSNIIIVEGRSDEIFLKAIYQAGREINYFRSQNLVFHYIDGYEKLSYASEAIVQMLKTQSYSPVYKEKICGLFDQPNRKTSLFEEIKSYFNDVDSKRFVLLDEPAIEYYYPISIINKEFELSLTKEQYRNEISTFISSATYENGLKGTFKGDELTKTDLARRVACQMTKENFSEVDESILRLLRTADELAYQ